MPFPLFIDIDISTPDEGGFPTAIAWSLPDGQMKSVIVSPDDDWSPWDNSDASVDVQHLMDQGVSGPDIIREMNDDLNGQTIFVDGLDEDENALELLYETYGEALSFEIEPMTKLFTSYKFEDLLKLRNDLALEYQFDLGNIEDKLKSLLFLYSNNLK